MGSLGSLFKKVFQKAKKSVRSQKRENILDQRVTHAQPSKSIANVLWAGHNTEEQGGSESTTESILPECRLPLIPQLDLALDFDNLRAATKSQDELQLFQEQARFEMPGIVEGTEDQDTVSQSAIEAGVDCTSDSAGIATRRNRFSQRSLHPNDVALESGAAALEGPPFTFAQQHVPMSDHEDHLNSELDDDENVADCLFSLSKSNLRARNWTDKDHEAPVPLNDRSLMRLTGIDGFAVQDLHKELQHAEQRCVSGSQSDTAEHSLLNSPSKHSLQYACRVQETATAIELASAASSQALASSSMANHPITHIREPSEAYASQGRACNFEKARLVNFTGTAAPEEQEVPLPKEDGSNTEDLESTYPDSDGGVPVNASDLISGTPSSDAFSVTSNSTEPKDGPPSAAEIAASGDCLATNATLPFSELYVSKRIQRRSAPGALPLRHDRSNSENTLVNSPCLGPATPSPPESKFPLVRPSAPRNFPGCKQGLDEIKCALRIQQAIQETREATDREWEIANAATELRHGNEIEELKEDQQDAIIALQEKHKDDLKKVRKKHGDKMRDVRGEVARALSEKKAVQTTSENITTERDVLQEELRTRDEQLERAVAAAQAFQANNDICNHQQDVQSGHFALLTQPIRYGPLSGPAPESFDQPRQQATQFNAVIAQIQDDLDQCQQTRNWYMEKSEKYHKALVENSARNSVMELEEDKVELRLRLRECEATLSNEQLVRKAEQETYWNQLMIMREEIRRSDLDAKAMDSSRKAALAANEANIRMMRRPMSDNEIDAAFWEQYRIVQRDCQELEQNAKGHEHQKVEKAEDINVLKAKILQLELQGPRDGERIRRLEEESSQLKFDHNTTIYERDMAIQDQGKQEPELWKSIRDRSLKEKDEKIAHLEAQLCDRVTETNSPDPRTPFSIEEATNPDGLVRSVQGSTFGPLFGNEEATRPEDFSTPNPGFRHHPLFGNEQITQPRIVFTPNRSPDSHQADISFF